MFTRVETRAFLFCSFLNMWNNLNLFSNHLVLTGRLSTHFDSIFTKKIGFYSPEYSCSYGIHESGNGQSTLENVARVYSDYSLRKNVQDRVYFFISTLAIINVSTLTWMKIDFLHFFFFLRRNYYFWCLYATISLCWCWSLQITFPTQFSNIPALPESMDVLKMLSRFPPSYDYSSSFYC